MPPANRMSTKQSTLSPLPMSTVRLDALTEMGRDDDEELHPFFRALTRLTERTVTAVCLFGRGDDEFLDRDCTRLAPDTQKPNMAEAAIDSAPILFDKRCAGRRRHRSHACSHYLAEICITA